MSLNEMNARQSQKNKDNKNNKNSKTSNQDNNEIRIKFKYELSITNHDIERLLKRYPREVVTCVLQDPMIREKNTYCLDVLGNNWTVYFIFDGNKVVVAHGSNFDEEVIIKGVGYDNHMSNIKNQKLDLIEEFAQKLISIEKDLQENKKIIEEFFGVNDNRKVIIKEKIDKINSALSRINSYLELAKSVYDEIGILMRKYYETCDYKTEYIKNEWEKNIANNDFTLNIDNMRSNEINFKRTNALDSLNNEVDKIFNQVAGLELSQEFQQERLNLIEITSFVRNLKKA